MAPARLEGLIQLSETDGSSHRDSKFRIGITKCCPFTLIVSIVCSTGFGSDDCFRSLPSELLMLFEPASPMTLLIYCLIGLPASTARW